MIHLGLFLLAVSFNVFLLVGCSAMQPTAPNEVHLSEKGGDCGSTVELNTGDSLTLDLEGNSTTGYTWEVISNDPAVLKPVGEPEYTAESDMIGSGGMYTFRFTAVAQGRATLGLIYHRSFEANVPALKSCEVSVTIR